MIGITLKPMKARLNENIHPISRGKVTKPSKMKPTAHKAVQLINSLNFYDLSRTIPSTNDPATPKNIKTPPKTALSTPLYPNGAVMAATTAPRLV